VLKRGVSLDGAPGLGNAPTIRALDVARIEALVVQYILGADPATPSLGYTADPRAAFDAVRNGKAAAAVLLNPTKVDDVFAVADAGAGNIATCGGDEDEATAKLLDGIPGTVVTLGDNAFPHGTLADYTTCYDPTWGRHKDRTQAVLGNHDYDAGNADGAFAYFGDRAGPRGLGYYSVDLGAWHVIVLNDNIPFGPGSAQDQWLVNDLAATTGRCTLAMWHVPLFLSSNFDGYTVNDDRKPLWDRLYAAHVDVVLNGHAHHYERFAPMRPDGTRDDAAGIREINAGTGGES